MQQTEHTTIDTEFADRAALRVLTKRAGRGGSNPPTLEGLPAVTRAYWRERASYTATDSRPPFSRERSDPESIARRRLSALQRAHTETLGLGAIDSLGEDQRGDLTVDDLAWVDADGVEHELPQAKPEPAALTQPQPASIPLSKVRYDNDHTHKKLVRIDWSDKPLGLKPPSEIAAEMGLTRGQVIEAHRRKGIQVVPESEEWLAAQSLAVRVRMGQVAAKPTRNMEEARAARRSQIDWASEPMGVELAEVMARRLGVAFDTVAKAHKRLGIKIVTEAGQRKAARLEAMRAAREEAEAARAAARAEAAERKRKERAALDTDDSVLKAELRAARERLRVLTREFDKLDDALTGDAARKLHLAELDVADRRWAFNLATAAKKKRADATRAAAKRSAAVTSQATKRSAAKATATEETEGDQ